MIKPIPQAARVLSIVTLVSAAIASVTTIVWGGSFPDPSPESVTNRALAEARGWSAATLTVAIPIAVVSLRAALRGSIRGRLIWLGALAYFVYTYLEFAVSPPFTALYLVYITSFACALSALVMGIASIDVEELSDALNKRSPRRLVAVFSLCIAGLLSIAWLKDIASRTFAGSFGWPTGTGAIEHVVHALDLGLQVPLGIAAGVLLWGRRPAGLLVGSIMLGNAVCMGAALTAMVVVSANDEGSSLWIATPFAAVWCMGALLAAAFFQSDA